CLVPLLLLPGRHVRVDLAAITQSLRRGGSLRRLPFLGAWPLWQRALAEEAGSLAEGAQGRRPLLLHHPLEGPLAQRYLRHLASLCAADCVAIPYSSAIPAEPPLALDRPLLPLVLAANRLSEQLQPQQGSLQAAPLLERPRLRHQLLALLETLP
ncbi:MAG: DNA mismatch repair protein MutS, partial [Cyanobium sp.]